MERTRCTKRGHTHSFTFKYIYFILTTFFYITWGFEKLLPLWYPVITTEELSQNKIQKVYIAGKPLVIYKKKDHQIVLHTDICPHQRASLSKGWLNEFGHIHCPYHGFEFSDGMFCRIPNPSKNVTRFDSKCILWNYPIREKVGIIYTIPTHERQAETEIEVPELYVPPEEHDKNFRSVTGHIRLRVPYNIVCENLLDMLHISYIHSFGNRYKPLPFSCIYEKMTELSGRSTFKYHSNRMTISNKVGRVEHVIVENEFHLPTNTITRVYAGNVVKTVFTTCVPTRKNETLLIWKVYRNFWKVEEIFGLEEIVNHIGDFVIRTLMEKTIEEDKSILKEIYYGEDIFEPKIVTPYDITIRKFRKSYREYLSKQRP
jgi:phenylpropionate dioxygenase-like ring-hydroxylating dioxygenase large terminal subunit